MEAGQFDAVVAKEWGQVPLKYKEQIKNLALVVESRPSDELLIAQGIERGGTLLGLYQGVPNTSRGGDYGVGMTLPDTITLFREPILEAAGSDPEEIQRVVRETLWHEIAHYFGLDDPLVETREDQGTNSFA